MMFYDDIKTLKTNVVHPDPAGPEIITKLGSGSIINSGFESGFQVKFCFQLTKTKL
jgi:hypothetical protein